MPAEQRSRVKRRGWPRWVLLVAALILVTVLLSNFRVVATGLFASFGEGLADLIERRVGLGAPTHIAISVYGTLPQRILLWVALVAAISGGIWAIVRSASAKWVPLLGVAWAGLVFTTCYLVLPPLSLTHGGATESLRTVLVLSAATTILFATVWLAAGALIFWLTSAWASLRWPPLLLATALACGVGALIPNGYRLHTLANVVMVDSAVRKLSNVNINGMVLDVRERRLYAIGIGTESLLAFDIDAIDRPPSAAAPGTGLTETLALNQDDREIYIFNGHERSLVTIASDTLRVVGRHPLPDVSPGDVVLEWKPSERRLMLASEADVKVGTPLLVLDRDGWRVAAEATIDAGNLLGDPRNSRVYLSFFRTTAALISYDMKALKMVANRQTHSKRFDRMILDEARNELLVAAPMEATIYRFNSDTLEPKGGIASVFGVRAMDVDRQRNLLLSVSLLSNELTVTRLDTYEKIATHRLGPWLRTIVADPTSGRAFVSSRYGIYVVDYSKNIKLDGGGM